MNVFENGARMAFRGGLSAPGRQDRRLPRGSPELTRPSRHYPAVCEVLIKPAFAELPGDVPVEPANRAFCIRVSQIR